MTTVTAVGYLRSDAIDDDPNGLQAITDFADMNGIALRGMYTDTLVKVGSQFVHTRAGLCDMLDEVSIQPAPVIVCSHSHLQHANTLDSTQVQINRLRLLVVGGTIQSTKQKPLSRSEKAKLRRESRIQLTERGIWVGTTPPFGYKRSNLGEGVSRILEVDPVEAPTVKLIFTQYLRLESVYKVTDLLNNRGIPTRKGKTWSRSGVERILKNQFYKGMIQYRSMRKSGAHPHIIAPIIFNKAGALMRENARTN